MKLPDKLQPRPLSDCGHYRQSVKDGRWYDLPASKIDDLDRAVIYREMWDELAFFKISFKAAPGIDPHWELTFTYGSVYIHPDDKTFKFYDIEQFSSIETAQLWIVEKFHSVLSEKLKQIQQQLKEHLICNKQD